MIVIQVGMEPLDDFSYLVDCKNTICNISKHLLLIWIKSVFEEIERSAQTLPKERPTLV